jgi:hypothetical protein
MKPLRRAKLLMLSSALALGGLTLAAAPAHAFTFHNCCIHSVYAPPGNIQLSPTGWSCPTLNVTGSGFDINDRNILVTLHTTDAQGNPTGTYSQSRLVPSNGSGYISLPPTFPNTTAGFEYWQATAEENGHFTAFSNIVECAP